MRYINILFLLVIFAAGCLDSGGPTRMDARIRDQQGDRAIADVVTDEGLPPKPQLRPTVPRNSVFFETEDAKPGKLVVDVKMKDVKDLAALSFRVKYPTKVLKLEHAEAKPVFGDAKKGIFMAKDMGDGSVSFGGAFYGLRSSKTFKDQVVGVLTFQVLEAGQAELSFPLGYVLALGPNRKTRDVKFVNSRLVFEQGGTE